MKRVRKDIDMQGTPTTGLPSSLLGGADPSLSLEYLRANETDIRAARAQRSLFGFMKTFWPVLIPKDPIWNWHIEYLCNELEQIAYRVAEGLPKEHDLVINIPPGTTKSVTCSIMFPVWVWTRWPWMRIITAAYSSALSLEQAEHSRDVIRSDLFKKLFPNIKIKMDKDTKSNFKILYKDKNGIWHLGGNRFSTSVGGTLTGFHGHLLIVDDPLDPYRAASEVELKNANGWMEETLSTRKVDKAVTATILIQQRLHQNDCTGNKLAKKKTKIRHISLPGEIRHFKEEVSPPELAEHYIDDLLDPFRMPWSVLEEMEDTLGQYGYSGQVGQKPVPPGGGMFKVDNFQITTNVPSDYHIVKVFRYWDKAGTERKGKAALNAAATAGVKMAKLKNGKHIVLDVKRGHWSTETREDMIRKTAEADGTNVTVYIEQEPGSGGKESAEATIKNLAGFSIYKDIPRGDKVFRADPYSVQVNNGNVLLLYGDWNHGFVEEHRFFPFGTTKDQVDAAAGAFARLTGKKIAGPVLR